MISGLAGLLPPRPVSAQHEHYLELCQKLGITTQDPDERGKQFMASGAIEIGKLAFDVQTVPTTDGNIIPLKDEWIRHENFKPLPSWCKSIIIGSCRDEVAMALLLALEAAERMGSDDASGQSWRWAGESRGTRTQSTSSAAACRRSSREQTSTSSFHASGCQSPSRASRRSSGYTL